MTALTEALKNEYTKRILRARSEWEDLTYTTYASYPSTYFAPISSATGEIELKGPRPLRADHQRGERTGARALDSEPASADSRHVRVLARKSV